MEFVEKHLYRFVSFQRNLSVEEIEVILKKVNGLPIEMKSILKAELRCGNKIKDINYDYPDKGSVAITLSERFRGKYNIKNVIHSKNNDPHYWGEDYCSESHPRYLILH